jgi:fructokinase
VPVEKDPKPLLGGIEGGGTKYNCILAYSPDQIVAEERIPTTTPAETLSRVIHFFKQNSRQPFSALGLANFGPLDLDPGSPTYGYLKTTPKKNWSDTDLLTPFRQAFGLPVVLDTDVNGAAYAEFLWGAAQGLDTFMYITIGTGIGGGVMANGRLLHGQTHPETGHILIPHDRQRDPYRGFCPFHQDCFEGLASGPAIQDRWGQPGETLPEDHPAWQLEAQYIAEAVMNYILVLSPQRVILGGGVMRASWLLPLIHQRVRKLMAGYLVHPNLTDHLQQYIVLPKLGGRAGVLGALGLAQSALETGLHGLSTPPD